jgi:uncharacterized membrane protein YkoI
MGAPIGPVPRSPLLSRTSVPLRLLLALTFVVAPFASRVRADEPAEVERRLATAKRSLVEAIDAACAGVEGGVPWHAELETERGRVVFSVDLAKGKRVVNVVLDAGDGAKVATEDEDEDEDRSALVGATKIPLADAVRRALAAKPGAAIEAKASLRDGVATIRVRIFAAGRIETVVVDGAGGGLLAADAVPAPAPKPAPGSGEDDGGASSKAGEDHEAFTSRFPVAADEWASSGVNPFLDLRPGVVLVLEGVEDGAAVRLEITVKDETVRIDGVEARVVEERETADGAIREVSRNYLAISKRTNDVYYLGEDVDEYAGGKVVGHAGSWRSGVAGATFGLLVPGSPLLGARFHQELAPGVAMDRGEVESVTGVVETARGRLVDCLVIEETSPLEPGHEETKAYARGIGLVRDGELRFVSRTAPK